MNDKERLVKIETEVKGLSKLITRLDKKFDEILISKLEVLDETMTDHRYQMKMMGGENDSIREMLENHDTKLYGNGETGALEEIKALKRTTFQIRDAWKVIPVIFGLGMGAMILVLLIFGVISPEVAKEWINR